MCVCVYLHDCACACVYLTLKVQEEVSGVVVDVSAQHFDQVPHSRAYKTLQSVQQND